MESLPITKDAKQKVAQQFYDAVRNNVIRTSLNFLELGYHLKVIRDEKLYEYLGDGGYDSFRMFISDANLGIKHATAYAFVRLYEVYMMKLGYKPTQLSDIPWSKLQALAGIVEPRNQQEADEWVEKARTLSNSDFQLEIREHKANAKEATFVPFPHIFRCKECGKWIVDVNDSNLCQGH